MNSVNESEGVETAKEKAEKMIKAIPISPEMETEAQGKKKAWEKLAKYFYELQMGGMGGGKMTMNDDIDLPDDWLDPHMKGKMSGHMEDKEFEKNKAIWDPEEEMEKLEKDIEVNMHGDDDDFDDFDYRDNSFGDDADMDDVDTDDMEGGGSGSGDDSDKSEDEKLQDSIDDALDKMSDGGLDDSKEGGQQGGEESGQSGQQGGQQGGQEGGQSGQSGQQSGQQGGQSEEDGASGGRGSQGGPTSSKDQKLKELKV